MVQLSDSSNSYSGGTIVTNQGTGVVTLLLPSAGVLGSGPLTMAGGLLIGNGANPITFANPVLLNGAAVFNGFSNSFAFSGPVALLGSSSLAVNDVAGLAFNSVLTESGGSRTLTAFGTGTLALNEANSFTGGFVEDMALASDSLNLGTLSLGTGAALRFRRGYDQRRRNPG